MDPAALVNVCVQVIKDYNPATHTPDGYIHDLFGDIKEVRLLLTLTVLTTPMLRP